MSNASPGVRITAFQQANRQRVTNWRTNKPAMERTIPVFRALDAADVRREYHRTQAELGYALKDSAEPQWQAALDALSDAINRRGPASAASSQVMYEFNRAVCRIALDTSISTPADTRALILADIRVVSRNRRAFGILIAEPLVAQWLERNGVDAASLREAG
jgi:hypothetical protein